MLRIPVFVSCPTDLNEDQKKQRKVIVDILEELQLEPRALGRSDYPIDFPLKEIYIIAKHCAGGIILGFEQLRAETGIRKKGVKGKEKAIAKDKPILIPTPWNHLEAGILYGLKLPLLIFKEEGVEGGVFDYGITDVFVHTMPPSRPGDLKKEELKHVFLKWHALVSQKYSEY